MTRRPGLTMTEVLVTLFIMALGTIAILTMFPLGMLQMGQALKDDRTAQAAAAADGFMRAYWRTEAKTDAAFAPGTGAFDAPGTPPGATTPLPPPGPGEASYPVFIDPMGWTARLSVATAGRDWVGNGTAAGTTSIPRRNLSPLDPTLATPAPVPMSPQLALRTCTMLDGLTYDQDGRADTSTGQVERDLRYNWLWVLQRPPGTRTAATMTIVVFEKRSNGYVAPNAEAVSAGVALTPGQTRIALAFDSGVAKGTWVLDATVNTAVSPAIRHARFYQVVSATENPGNPMLLDVELDKPVERVDGGSAAYTGTVVVLAGVADVYTRTQPVTP